MCNQLIYHLLFVSKNYSKRQIINADKGVIEMIEVQYSNFQFIMSNGFNPLSMFKPTGNPIVQKLLETPQTPINDLLDQESFPTEFRRDGNQLLQKYMTYKKYFTLVEYITELGQEQDKNRAYKYPFVAAEILSIENSHTFKYFVSGKPILEQQIIVEEIQVEQQVDSDRSFMSSRSEGSIVSDESQAQKEFTDTKQVVENAETQQLPNLQIEKTTSQINEDDFPFIEQVKKVKKIKQKIQKIINHEYQPLLNKLFEYFNSPLNHTLAGYVCKVISALLAKNPSIYAELLHKAHTTLFLSHIESRSVQELLVRILTYESDSESDIAFQYNLLMLCLHKIFDDGDKLVIQNLSFVINDVLTKISQGQITSKHYKKLIKEILRLSFFQKLCEYFEQTIKQLEEFKHEKDLDEIQITQIRIKQFSKLAATFIDLLLKVKGIEELKEDFQSVSHQYEEHFNQFTESAYKKLQLEAIEAQTQNGRRMFGMTKILLINILFTLIKNNFGFCQQILAEKQCFFQILLQLVKKSPFNSILHNSVFSIFDFFVEGLKKKSSDNDRVIIGSLFRQAFDVGSKYAFLQFCYQTFEDNQSLTISQKKGYTGHLIKICLEIHNLVSSKDDQLIDKLKKTPEWQYIVSSQLQAHIERTKLNLGSYVKIRNTKARIEFDKALILENHKEFLKGTKFTTLDEFQNFDDQEQSDTQEDRHHQARHVVISKETKQEIESMEMEQFEMNAGIKKEADSSGNDQTADSIGSLE